MKKPMPTAMNAHSFTPRPTFSKLKPKATPVRLAFALLTLGLFTISSSVMGASGTWIQTTSGGLWSASANWSGSTVADVSGSTADFSTINITADNTVHMDASHTLTALLFGDTDTSTAAGWTLDDNSSSGANILTLAGTTPSITVNALGTSKSATISAVIAGSTAWSKAGAGTLVLSGANTFNSATTIGAGTLSVGTLNYVASGTLSPTTSSSLGVPSSAANGTIYIGSSTTTGTLSYPIFPK